MFTFKVYHAIKPTFGVGESLEFPKGYKLVAEVTIPEDNLEHVFLLTNDNWTHNMGVKAGEGSQRSTSVGDVVVDEQGKRFRCGLTGWDELENTQ